MQATVFTLADDAPGPHRSLIDVEVEVEADEVAADDDAGPGERDPTTRADEVVGEHLLGTVVLDDGREADLPRTALQGSSLRHLRVGQRLTVALDPDRPDERGRRRVTRARIVGIGEGERIR